MVRPRKTNRFGSTVNVMATRPDIVTQCASYVKRLFRQQVPEWAVYHNLSHTREVVAASRQIGAASGIGSQEMEILTIAAWFHDSGYTVIAKGHEELSAEMATEFLVGKGYPRRRIGRVARCIRSTRIPQRPKYLLEKILCDADLSALGKKSFFRQNDRLKEEIEMREGVTLDDVMWTRRSIRFLREHRYHTAFARSKFGKTCLANIARLKSTLGEIT